MHRRKLTYVLVIIVVLALSGTGLYIRFASQHGGSGNGGTTTAGPTATGHPGIHNQRFAIGTDLPVSGPKDTAALSAQYGVDLAVSRNANLGNGNTLSVIHMDDTGADGADPTKGAENVRTLIANPQVMAIVGPFDSAVAAVEIPLVETDGIVEISPNETNPGLTVQRYAQHYSVDFTRLHPAGSHVYYFRIPGNDLAQGEVDAQLALQQLHAKTAFVVDDNTAYGKGLADYFTQSFTAAGGKIVGARASLTPSQVAHISGLAVAIGGDKPDIVFYGGTTSPDVIALKVALGQAGFQHPLVGGSGIADDPGFSQSGGTAAGNTYGTAVALDVSALTSAPGQDFLNDFETVYPAEPLLPYSAMAYDAAMVEINAIKSVLASGMPVTRAAVRTAVAATHYDGATGQISFDANGDNAHPVFSVYATDASGVWNFDHVVQG